jgi:hypothetical protein
MERAEAIPNVAGGEGVTGPLAQMGQLTGTQITNSICRHRLPRQQDRILDIYYVN